MLRGRFSVVLAGATKVPSPTLNGVWVDALDAPAEVVGALLDRFVADGLPHCLQLRPGCDPELNAVGSRRGMTPEEDAPLMVLEADRFDADQPAKLTIRRLGPEQAHEHAALAAAAFGASEEDFDELVPRELIALAGVRCYVGELDGEVVTTSVGVVLGDSVGIFNVATPAVYRRRGYGSAVTTHALREGFAAGASWAWLRSSPAGLRVYERLGFRTVESWQVWIATP